jgi:hypothetical protein
MPKAMKIDLSGVKALGAIHFLRAEWWREESRAVVLRYAMEGHERPLGLRLDMDKRVILDPLDDAGPVPQATIKKRTEQIWEIVAKHRAKDKAFAS